MACSSGCRYGDCASYGECLRRKNLQIDRYSLQGTNQPQEKKKNHTLARFRDLVKSGVTPQSPLKSDVEKAEKVAERVL